MRILVIASAVQAGIQASPVIVGAVILPPVSSGDPDRGEQLGDPVDNRSRKTAAIDIEELDCALFVGLDLSGVRRPAEAESARIEGDGTRSAAEHRPKNWNQRLCVRRIRTMRKFGGVFGRGRDPVADKALQSPDNLTPHDLSRPASCTSQIPTDTRRSAESGKQEAPKLNRCPVSRQLEGSAKWPTQGRSCHRRLANNLPLSWAR